MIRVFAGEEAYWSARAGEPGPLGTPPEVLRRVEEIVRRVREGGDRALAELSREIEGVELDASDLAVPPERIAESAARAPETVRSAIRTARGNVHAFHERQKELGFRIERADGSVVGQKLVPLAAAGIYVPGGKATYPSTLIMNAVPARIAGVERLVAATPPGCIERSPALAFAMELLDITEVYRLGGAQAIAAMALGTETVPRVDKIVGPGNAYVTTAKRLLFGLVGIDSLAGPSEIVVLADGLADPRYVAADLVSQAEHGSGEERAILVTPSGDLAERVRGEIAAQLETLPRAADVREVLARHGAAVVVSGMDEAVRLVDRIAPEHLEILTDKPEEIAERVRNAGAIFLGPHSPVPIGDFLAGPNHVLPTGGTARFASPLGVYDFVKRSSIIRYSRERLERDRADVETFARAEGFEGHARAVAVRFSE